MKFGVYSSMDAEEKFWTGGSVEIEQNDLFVVLRGEMVHPGGSAMLGNGAIVKVPPKFDNGYDGVVFEVMEVCGNLVASKVHFPFELDDRTFSLNLENYETMTVTRKYLDKLRTGRKDESSSKNETTFADLMKRMSGNNPPEVQGLFIPPNLPPEGE